MSNLLKFACIALLGDHVHSRQFCPRDVTLEIEELPDSAEL